MNQLRLMALISTALVMAAVTAASAGQSLYGRDRGGVEVTYDDAAWQASELASRPYFVCIAPDCGSASCLVISSLDPDFATWPDPIDKTALDALDGIFLAYEQAGGHDDAAILRPTSAVSIGDRETLVNVIRSTTALGGYLSSKYMFRDGGDTHIVTCEGDEESITALQTRIEALVGAIRVAHP